MTAGDLTPNAQVVADHVRKQTRLDIFGKECND